MKRIYIISMLLFLLSANGAHAFDLPVEWFKELHLNEMKTFCPFAANGKVILKPFENLENNDNCNLLFSTRAFPWDDPDTEGIVLDPDNDPQKVVPLGCITPLLFMSCLYVLCFFQRKMRAG